MFVFAVTPLAGVWIEKLWIPCSQPQAFVTPLAGVWIERSVSVRTPTEPPVTPFAGVWIESVAGNVLNVGR